MKVSLKNLDFSNYTYIFIISSVIFSLLIGLIGFCCRVFCNQARTLNNQRVQSNVIDLPIIINHISNLNQNPELVRKNTDLFINYYNNELKGFIYKKELNLFSEECAICIESMVDNQTLVIKLPCNHYFHENCIKDWIKANVGDPKCPCCNDNIIEHLEKLRKENAN